MTTLDLDTRDPVVQLAAMRNLAVMAAKLGTEHTAADDAAMIKRGYGWRVAVAACQAEDVVIHHWYYREKPTRFSIASVEDLAGTVFDFVLTNLSRPTRGNPAPSQRRESEPVLPGLPVRLSPCKFKRGDAVRAQWENDGRWYPATFVQAMSVAADGRPVYKVRWVEGREISDVHALLKPLKGKTL